MLAAPSGAVMRIASTATMSTSFPQGRPNASGTEVSTGYTVALGE